MRYLWPNILGIACGLASGRKDKLWVRNSSVWIVFVLVAFLNNIFSGVALETSLQEGKRNRRDTDADE
jgi:hypothetical protein